MNDMMDEVLKLQNEFVLLETAEQKERFRQKIHSSLSGKTGREVAEFSQAIHERAIETIGMSEQLMREIELKQLLKDVEPAVTWSYIAEHYFGKSRSWFSQRMNGYHVNNQEAVFTAEEKKKLANALLDLSERIKNSALQLQEHCF